MSFLINLKKNIDMNVEFDITTNLSFGDTLFSICCQGVQRCEDLHRDATTYSFISINEIKHEQSADREHSTGDVWNLFSSKSESSASFNDTGRFSDKKVIELQHKQQSKDDDGSYSETTYKFYNTEERLREHHARDISPVLLKTVGSDVEMTLPQTHLDLHENTTACDNLLNMPTTTSKRKRKSVKGTCNYNYIKRRLEDGAPEMNILQESITSRDTAQENRLMTYEQTQENASKTSEECGQEVQPNPLYEARNVKMNAFSFDSASDGNRLSAVTTKEHGLSEKKDELESTYSDLSKKKNSELQADLALSSSSSSESDSKNKNVRKRCRRRRKREYKQDEAGQSEHKTRYISINSKFPTQTLKRQPQLLEDNDPLIVNLFGSKAKKENIGADEEYSNPFYPSQELGDSCSKECLFAGAVDDNPEEKIGGPIDTNPNEHHELSKDTYPDTCIEPDSNFDNDYRSFEEVHDPGLFPLKIIPIKRTKKVRPTLRKTLIAFRTLRMAIDYGLTCCEEYCWLNWPTASLIRAMSKFK
ncbi:hypothetical protein ACJMK2_036665 [Sinanodonta woodiana]|uniref:Uncharacterized protein n=1 Tax=Sinanodonta woodiana TaxID=1069815 RepID=A0ABD3WLH1_SINWO